MAKCDLSIVLDDPQEVHSGGSKIGGVVRVHVDADVECKGLEVKSVWRTHGRGNVATGTAGTMTLFQGQWRAGENHEYRFELPIAHWPPTYHGYYLSIDHSVDARAKIPWAFDPKASEPFPVVAACGPEDAQIEKNVTEIKGVVGCILTAVFLAFVVGFCVMFAAAGPFSLFLLIIPAIGGIWWFFRVFLPKYLLGNVECNFDVDQVSPGGKVHGELVIRPRKNVSINEINLHFRAREQCVSGSGSNRTTHTHVFFDKVETVQPATTLTAGQERRFPIELAFPPDAAYSIELNDNKVIWSTTLRVDIPRWPDWVKEIPLTVVPTGGPSDRREPIETSSVPRDNSSAAVSEAGASITFHETANHIWSVRDERDQVEVLVEAVAGLTFDLKAEIERRLLYAGEDDPHVYEDGYAVWAHYPDPELPLVLYVPHELADEFEQLGRDTWRGRGTIVGWDASHGRLQIKLERPT